VRFERNDGFRAIVRDFETYADADAEVPASLADVLRPYQEAGFRWLETLERLGFGGILADDMGLGKTLQVIAHILARKEAGAGGVTLVVAPASLVYNWMAELERFAPQLDAAAVLGTKKARGALIAASAEHDVLVTSYDLMKRDVDDYERQHYARVVLDEAQYIKNATTQAALCAKRLPSDVRLALTGTPIENRVLELWSIFDFLMPGMLGDRKGFSERFEGAVENGEDGAARRLQCMVSPFILRRLKADVLTDLPEKNESVVYARMSGEQETLYKANQDRLALQIAHELPDEFRQNKLQVLAELTKLRQLCCDPRLFYEDYTGGSAKLDTCMELVRTAVDGGHQILLFSQFTSMIDLIAERLAAEKLGYLVLTGSTSKEERARLVERFQAGEAPVFLISLKAGGVGLNLTAADVVIHYDPWWNLAAQNQATDRAHRIGQTRAVSVFKLIAQDTIEERIVRMQERKRDLAESVLGGEGVASTAITREDVLALLGA
jgi:SNF2 family DNA or RNA helicase